MKRIAMLLLTALCAMGVSWSGPPVTVIVHVPLTYENGRDISAGALATIHNELGAMGPIVDHRGTGSWINPQGRFVLDLNDDVFVTTTLDHARFLLPNFLPKMRRQLDQDSVLGEITTGVRPIAGEQARTQVEVNVPEGAAATVAHALAVDAGGSSQYGINGVQHISVDALPGDVQKLRVTLTKMHYKWTERPILFILVAR